MTQLLAGKFEGGCLPLSQPKIDWDKLPPIDDRKTISGILFRSLGLGNFEQSGVAHFRLVYISTFIMDPGYPWLKIFEVVPGATISGTSIPNATMACILPLTFPLLQQEANYHRIFKSDQNGRFSVLVPYPTDNKSGGVETGKKYAIFASSPTQLWQGEAEIALEAVQKGLTAGCFAVTPISVNIQK